MSQASCSSPIDAPRIGDVVHDDEMHALVIEGVVRLAEEFLEGLAMVERGVVLAWHELDVLDLEVLHDVAELGHPFAPLLTVLGGVGEVAGEDDEVGRVLQVVDRGDRLLQRAGVVGVLRRPFEAPVAVGELDEVELVVSCGRDRVRTTPARDQDGAAEAGELEKLAAVDRMRHGKPRLMVDQ